MTFFWIRLISVVKRIFIQKRKEQTMNRKHLVAIGVVIAVLLLLYWLFVAEDMNAWLNVN